MRHKRTGRAALHVGFSLVDLATTIAGLVIVLGLMVSLAGFVRKREAVMQTRQLLVRLERAAGMYQQRYGHYPPVAGLVEPESGESQWHAAAGRNSQAFVAALRSDRALAVEALGELPLSIYDETILRDAWGTPVAFLPPGAANVGMLPQNRAFFLSAGPDRRFGTLADNLYSYEQ